MEHKTGEHKTGPTVEQIREELSPFPVAVLEEFDRARQTLPDTLTEAQTAVWALGGVEIAQLTVRSWEAAAQYYKVSPLVLGFIPFNYFVKWAQCGKHLGPGGSHPCRGLLRGQPRHRQQAQVPAHRELGQSGAQPLQGHLEVQHPVLQVLRLQPSPSLHSELPGTGAVRRLLRRPVPSFLRPLRRVPDPGPAAVSVDRGG